MKWLFFISRFSGMFFLKVVSQARFCIQLFFTLSQNITWKSRVKINNTNHISGITLRVPRLLCGVSGWPDSWYHLWSLGNPRVAGRGAVGLLPCALPRCGHTVKAVTFTSTVYTNIVYRSNSPFGMALWTKIHFQRPLASSSGLA